MRLIRLGMVLVLGSVGCGILTKVDPGGQADMATAPTILKPMLGQTLEDADNFASMHCLSLENCWVGGTNGNVWRITDAGKWEKVRASDKPGLVITSLYFIDKSTGFAGTNASQDTMYILKTLDGGATWKESLVRPLQFSFSRLHFIDALRGFAVTGVSEGAVFRTVDGGVMWEEVVRGGSNIGACGYRQLNDVTVGPNGDVWVAGFRCQQSDALLLRSTDGGATFAEVPVSFRLSIFDIDALPNGDLWATAFGAISRSTDQGKTWVSQTPDKQGDAAPISGVAFADANRGVAARFNASTLYFTNNAGASWTQMNYDGDLGTKTFIDVWVGDKGVGRVLSIQPRNNKGVVYNFQMPN